MTNVPRKVSQLHPKVQVTEVETGTLTPFFFKWLVGLWERSGGFDDAVATLENNASFTSNNLLNDDQIAEIEQQISILQPIPKPQEFISRSVNASYTATSFELVSMTAKGTISLPEFPNDNDKVKLFNKNGKQITLSGNGNTIDGETSFITVRKNTLLSVEYFTDIGEWIIV